MSTVAEKAAAKAVKDAEKAAAKAAEDSAPDADEGSGTSVKKDTGEWPEPLNVNKFHFVPHKDGVVVFNNVGQRATEVVPEAKAKDIVRQNNAALGLK